MNVFAVIEPIENNGKLIHEFYLNEREATIKANLLGDNFYVEDLSTNEQV